MTALPLLAAFLVQGSSAPAARGDSLLERGRWEEAEAAYRRAAAGPDSLRARLGQARLLELRGRRDEARRHYTAILAAYNRGGRRAASALLAAAGAAERLSLWEPLLARDALRLYDEAAAADPDDPEPRLRAAALLLSRYNGAEAGRAYADLRRRWPRHPRALLGQAQVRRFLGDGDPVALAESSLAADPDLVDARVFLARLALEADDWAGAARETDRALAANPRSREALAVRAALALVRGDSAAAAAVDRAIAADDARAADHLVAGADLTARARRYAEAADLAARAVARDSLAWRGWAVLGVNRLRLGDIAGGRAALETALGGDPFDLWTKNTLDLLDTLQRFPETASQRFRFVMDGRESALLTLYFAPLAEEAYRALAARYGIQPRAPIRVEVYTRHADFSVRTIGLAGIGALGACFGRVIAMDSPSARDRGQFNWGSTLWHEIAHTFHLALSHHRVPRWLTEGLAVLEERRARPGWGDDVGPAFLRALAAGDLPPLSRLNDGFIRPANAEMLAHAYLLASLAAVYLEEAHGAGVAPRMLAAYARRLDTRTVVQQVLGTQHDSLDAAFDGWLRRRYAVRIASLDAFVSALHEGHEMARAGLPVARVRLEQARDLFPEYAGPDDAYRALARIHTARGDRAAAAAALSATTARDETAYDANVALAGHLDALGRADEAVAALERAVYISPLDPGLHDRLAAHYARLGRHGDLVRERRALIALGPTDRAGAWYRLAEAYVGAGRAEAAREAVLRSLEVAPGYADAQDLLLRLAEGRRP